MEVTKEGGCGGFIGIVKGRILKSLLAGADIYIDVSDDKVIQLIITPTWGYTLDYEIEMERA